MTVDKDPEKDAIKEPHQVISKQNDGSSSLSLLRMSPAIKEVKKENILSDSTDSENHQVHHFLNKDADDKVTTVINNGPKIEKGPNNKREYSETFELNSVDGSITCLDKNVNPPEILCKCPLCDECFSSARSFTVHIRQHNHNNQPNTCRLCNKTLSSASSLDRHMLVHSGERPFKCRICSMAFTTNGNMHRHMRTHGDAIEDSSKLKNASKRKSNYDAESTSPTKKTNLQEEQDEVQAVCLVCGKTFLCEYDLQCHMETHPNDPIRCPDCGLISKDYYLHTQHQCLENDSNNENGNKLPNSKSFVGFHDMSFIQFTANKFPLIAKSLCEREIRHPSSAFHHFQCNICNKSFPSGRALELHKIDHTDKIGSYCASCKCDFQTPQYFQEHQLKHRPVEHCWGEFGISEEQIAKHDKSTKNDFLVLIGLKTTNLQNDLENDPSAMKEDNFENMSYFLSGQSEESLMHEKKLESDSNKANPNSSDFADIQSILYLTSNTTLMPYITSSPVTATTASPLQSQIVSCPHPESPLLAESAQASPATPQREESDSNAYKESAIENDKEETSNHSIKAQKISRKPCKLNGQRNIFKCNKCKYTTVDKGSLRRHLRIHNKERPFKCVLCNTNFTTKANCERHVRKRHKMTAKDQISRCVIYNQNMVENKDSDEQSSESNKVKTVCKFCKVDFKILRILKHHLRSSNSCSQKPFLCEVCKMRCSTKNNCIRHVVNMHPELKNKPMEAVCVCKKDEDSTSNEAGKEKHEEPLNLTVGQNLIPAIDDNHNTQHYGDDVVNAAEGLVCLSEMNPPQIEPLDLSVHALDLSATTNDGYTFSNSANINEWSRLSPGDLTRVPFVFSALKIDDSPRDSKSQNDLEKPYLCPFCDSRFTLKSNMDRHIKKKHPEHAKPTRSRNYIPTVCTSVEKQNTSAVSTETRNALRSVLSNKGLAQLTSQQNVATSTEFDNQAFNYSKITLTQQEENNFEVKPASSSGEQRETAIDLASISDVIDTANCQEFKLFLNDVRGDDKAYANKSGQKEVKAQTNAKQPNKKRSSYADSPNSIACPYCKRNFPWSSSLRRHILTHTGQKPFKCPNCPVWFTTKSNCERHFGRKHSSSGDFCSRSVPERPFKCKLCTSSTFSTQGNLRKHYYLKHCTKTGFGKNHILDLLSLSKFQRENSQKDLTNCAIRKASHDSNDAQVNQPNSYQDNAVFCCHLCYKMFQIREEYFAHIEYHYTCGYTQENLQSKPPSDNETVRINCAFCKEICISMNMFSDHMLDHMTRDNVQSSRSTSHSCTDQSTPSSSFRVRNRSPNSLLYLMQSNYARPNTENVTETETSRQNEDNTDLIQNLLGIQDSKIIDQMLDSADSAARLLGVKKM